MVQDRGLAPRPAARRLSPGAHPGGQPGQRLRRVERRRIRQQARAGALPRGWPRRLRGQRGLRARREHLPLVAPLGPEPADSVLAGVGGPRRVPGRQPRLGAHLRRAQLPARPRQALARGRLTLERLGRRHPGHVDARPGHQSLAADGRLAGARGECGLGLRSGQRERLRVQRQEHPRRVRSQEEPLAGDRRNLPRRGAGRGHRSGASALRARGQRRRELLQHPQRLDPDRGDDPRTPERRQRPRPRLRLRSHDQEVRGLGRRRVGVHARSRHLDVGRDQAGVGEHGGSAPHHRRPEQLPGDEQVPLHPGKNFYVLVQRVSTEVHVYRLTAP